MMLYNTFLEKEKHHEFSFGITFLESFKKITSIERFKCKQGSQK